MAEVRWTEQAIDDIDNIAEYISKDSLTFAQIQTERFFERAKTLEKQPLTGRIVPELNGQSTKNPSIRTSTIQAKFIRVVKLQLVLMMLLAVEISFGQETIQRIDWDIPEYSYAKAFLYGIDIPADDLIIEQGELNSTVFDTSGVQLSKLQSDRVISVITGENNSSQDERTWCFIPHHGIVYYNYQGQPIGHISICFYCGQKEIFPAYDSPTKGLEIVKQIIEEIGHPVYDRIEFYREFAKIRKHE